MKINLHIYKVILNKISICLFVLVMTGVFNASVAQNVQSLNNERKIVECTPVKTKRDIAHEGLQTQELRVAERNHRLDLKEVLSSEDDKDYSKFMVKPEMTKATETKLHEKKVVKKTKVINDK